MWQSYNVKSQSLTWLWSCARDRKIDSEYTPIIIPKIIINHLYHTIRGNKFNEKLKFGKWAESLYQSMGYW